MEPKEWKVPDPPEQKHWRLVKGPKAKDPYHPVDLNDPAATDTTDKTKKSKGKAVATASESATKTGNVEGLRRSTRKVPKSDAIAIDESSDNDEDDDDDTDGGTTQGNSKKKKRSRSNAEDEGSKKKTKTSRTFTLDYVKRVGNEAIMTIFNKRLETNYPDDKPLSTYLSKFMDEILDDSRKPDSWGEESRSILRETVPLPPIHSD